MEEFEGPVGLPGALDPNYEAPPMIISAALTGAVPDKQRYPTLPTQPAEIAEAALACAEAGAAIVHLHMRDANHKQVQDAERLIETIAKIREVNQDLIICATSTSRGAATVEERLTSLRLPEQLRPDLVSLTMGSYNTPTGINSNPREDIERIAAELKATGIAPELEIFEPGMLYTYFRMHKAGKISRPGIINILLGVDGAGAANARELIHIADLVPQGIEWAVAGIGRYQKPMVWLGALLGGNVRVGMEDDPRGEFEGWDNVLSVKRAVDIAQQVGRAVETAGEARKRLNLKVRGGA